MFYRIKQYGDPIMDIIEILKNKDEIGTIVNKLFLYTDEMNWDGLIQEVFTSKVEFDTTSLGGDVNHVSSGSIIEGWKEGFKELESVHHQIGNIDIAVSESQADVFCYGTATQYKTNPSGNNTRTFIGTYDLKLVKDGESNQEWKICGFKFNLKFMEGNVDFE